MDFLQDSSHLISTVPVEVRDQGGGEDASAESGIDPWARKGSASYRNSNDPPQNNCGGSGVPETVKAEMSLDGNSLEATLGWRSNRKVARKCGFGDPARAVALVRGFPRQGRALQTRRGTTHAQGKPAVHSANMGINPDLGTRARQWHAQASRTRSS